MVSTARLTKHPVLIVLSILLAVAASARVVARIRATRATTGSSKQLSPDEVDQDPHHELDIGSIAPASNDDYSAYDATLAGSFPASDPPGNY